MHHPNPINQHYLFKVPACFKKRKEKKKKQELAFSLICFLHHLVIFVHIFVVITLMNSFYHQLHVCDIFIFLMQVSNSCVLYANFGQWNTTMIAQLSPNSEFFLAFTATKELGVQTNERNVCVFIYFVLARYCSP